MVTAAHTKQGRILGVGHNEADAFRAARAAEPSLRKGDCAFTSTNLNSGEVAYLMEEFEARHWAVTGGKIKRSKPITPNRPPFDW